MADKFNEDEFFEEQHELEKLREEMEEHAKNRGPEMWDEFGPDATDGFIWASEFYEQWNKPEKNEPLSAEQATYHTLLQNQAVLLKILKELKKLNENL